MYFINKVALIARHRAVSSLFSPIVWKLCVAMCSAPLAYFTRAGSRERLEHIPLSGFLS